MNTVLNHKKKFLALGLAIAGAIYVNRKHKGTRRVCGVDYPYNTVILHTWPRVKFVPNMDPFSMKLETYLRINQIPYQMDENHENGPDNKSCLPWIEYNGKRMAGSQMIIKYLSDIWDKDLNEHLPLEDKEKATEIQTWLEEHTYWVHYHLRWYVFWDDMLINMFKCPAIVNKFVRGLARWYQKKLTEEAGIGCHSDEEVKDMLVEDLRKFSDTLGDKKFIMGDTISEVDCAAFGILSQVRWCSPAECPGYQLLTGGEMQNVMDYLDRIREMYWSDWDEIMKTAKCKI
ncbi:failed axon connections homolog [Mercenaria mercenaria]|uniref:failed axon connections homolog n=1 Tax=Mercenaria mercenaria TaxID=6596 RepID=UPI00234F812C|nr:failed axon connections homolog [Mercenaria mercenaria]